ncbi:MAG: outer membrane beta-barrel protein [Parvularculaceae bacterium]
MRTVTIAALSLLASGAANAQDECIENAAGQLVCGADAQAVRARIRAEDRLQTPELNVPAAPTQAARDDGVVSAALAGAEVAGPTYASADGREEDSGSSSSSSSSRGSVYNSYGRTAFVRGGYVFDGSGAGDYDALGFSAGYRKTWRESGRSRFGLEGELIYSRDSETFDVLGTPVDVTTWGLAAVGGLRWNYLLSDAVSPFASVAIGPGYFHANVDDGVTEVSDGDLTFVYTGRAGLEVNVSEQISLEGAYRYLGTSQSGTPGYHSAEFGLNYNF